MFTEDDTRPMQIARNVWSAEKRGEVSIIARHLNILLASTQRMCERLCLFCSLFLFRGGHTLKKRSDFGIEKSPSNYSLLYELDAPQRQRLIMRAKRLLYEQSKIIMVMIKIADSSALWWSFWSQRSEHSQCFAEAKSMPRKMIWSTFRSCMLTCNRLLERNWRV